MARTRRFVAACALALSSGAAPAQEVFLDRAGFEGQNLYVDAERVIHKGRAYLSIQIHASDWTTRRRPGGANDMESVVEHGPGAAFLPVIVACDRIVLEHAGHAIRPDIESLCVEPTRLSKPASMPLFVAFPFPAADGVREARLVVPVTVLRPDPPVQRSLQEEKRVALYEPHVDASRLGEHTLHATVQLR